ncbi:MAG: hypothetical protein QE278_02885 [Limnobacter sp.]|nr:hypothetical protein [Limnobacter sp.]
MNANTFDKPLPSTAQTHVVAAVWVSWLTVATAFTVLFGLVMVLLPDLTSQAFGLLLYQDAGRLVSHPPEALAYIQLAHAVMGSLMVGWGAGMFLVTRTLFKRGERVGWQILTYSIPFWYVPDTLFSLISGFWPNALMNTGFVVMLMVPLWASRHAFPPR